MSNLEFIEQKLEGESFSDQSCEEFLSVNSHFENCKFENIRVKDATFGGGVKQSTYRSCSFNGSRFDYTVPGVVRFENCTFLDVKIKEFFCTNADFINCSFSGKLSKAKFYDKGRFKKTNEVYGNDFSRLEMDDVGFSSVDLAEQKLPEGENFVTVFDVERLLRDVRSQYTSSSDITTQEMVFKLLEILLMKNEDENNQMFLDKRNFPKDLKQAVDILFSTARGNTYYTTPKTEHRAH